MSKKNTINYIGRIIDYEKQAPIRGAKVSLKTDEISLTSHTDIEGIYRFQINPDKAKNVQGQIYVEASGYRPYQYSIWLSSAQKDLGDVRLGDSGNSNTSLVSNSSSSSQNNSNSNSSNNNNLIAIITIIMIGFFIFISQSIRNPNESNENNDNNNPRRNSPDSLYYDR
ncbi:MAG: carboxypeptidase regulatory-like domain-containing protein [Methylacidiphilales bacterium]|nr:carboxypeptidase regulatory-like domain-containing protein [Candidatus Methylacidiphilales bacterium]